MSKDIFFPEHAGNKHEVKGEDFYQNGDVGNFEALPICYQAVDYEKGAYKENQQLDRRTDNLNNSPGTFVASLNLFSSISARLTRPLTIEVL